MTQKYRCFVVIISAILKVLCAITHRNFNVFILATFKTCLTLEDSPDTYNHHIPQRALNHQMPIQSLQK